ncbi:MAG: type II toxin-antitoxin system VapC family toxin [Candidatus Acidiferrum sp.]
MTTPIVFERVVVDSSGWVEFLANGPKADRFAPYLEAQTATLFLPSIVVYEVHKKLYRERGKGSADEFIAQAFGFRERLIELTLELAILASKTSFEASLSMADAIIYATADKYRAQLITSDAHFANLPRVTFI